MFSTTKGSSYSVTDETFKTTMARYVRMMATQKAQAPALGFGRGRGRGGAGATQPATQSALPPAAPATLTAAPGGYSLFDFEVLKD